MIALITPMAFLCFRQIEATGNRPTPGLLGLSTPDAIGHVGVSGVRNTGLTKCLNVPLILFDFRVPIRKRKDDGRLIVDVAIAKAVDGKSVLGEERLPARVVFR